MLRFFKNCVNRIRGAAATNCGGINTQNQYCIQNRLEKRFQMTLESENMVKFQSSPIFDFFFISAGIYTQRARLASKLVLLICLLTMLQWPGVGYKTVGRAWSCMAVSRDHINPCMNCFQVAPKTQRPVGKSTITALDLLVPPMAMPYTTPKGWSAPKYRPSYEIPRTFLLTTHDGHLSVDLVKCRELNHVPTSWPIVLASRLTMKITRDAWAVERSLCSQTKSLRLVVTNKPTHTGTSHGHKQIKGHNYKKIQKGLDRPTTECMDDPKQLADRILAVRMEGDHGRKLGRKVQAPGGRVSQEHAQPAQVDGAADNLISKVADRSSKHDNKSNHHGRLDFLGFLLLTLFLSTCVWHIYEDNLSDLIRAQLIHTITKGMMTNLIKKNYQHKQLFQWSHIQCIGGFKLNNKMNEGLAEPQSYRNVVVPIYSEKQVGQFCQLHSFNNILIHSNPKTPPVKPSAILEWFAWAKSPASDYPYPHHRHALSDSYTKNGNFTESAFALWAFMTHKLAMKTVMDQNDVLNVTIPTLHALLDSLRNSREYPFEGLVVHSLETTGKGVTYGHASSIVREKGQLLWLDPEKPNRLHLEGRDGQNLKDFRGVAFKIIGLFPATSLTECVGAMVEFGPSPSRKTTPQPFGPPRRPKETLKRPSACVANETLVSGDEVDPNPRQRERVESPKLCPTFLFSVCKQKIQFLLV